MARILQHVTVARDGWHNGFTDLLHWQNAYWVTYRKGAAHVSMDGQAVVSVSTDRRRFREAGRVKVYGDNRDPKLFAIDAHRIMMTVPSWQNRERPSGYASTDLRTYVCFSEDGFNWSQPEQILEPAQWLWRVREHQGMYYGLVQELKDLPQGRGHGLTLMTSTDLMQWTPVARIGDETQGLCESDIHWRPDGTAWIVARSASSTGPAGMACFCEAKPPYDTWTCTRLDGLIHAAVFCEHDGRLYVAGRSAPALEGAEGFPTTHSLAVWEVKHGSVRPVLRIPATGDCSYPGFIKDPEGRLCLSYYSQHAYHLGVIDADADRWASGVSKADVYFAELELP